MPRATVTLDAQEVQLKSCPGGWVKLRQLPYHEMLVRRDKAARYSMDQSREGTLDIETLSANTRQMEFAQCIVEHNLEDDLGNLLDFSNPNTLRVLDPRIGEEIGDAIDKLHQTEEDLQPFTKPASPSSTVLSLDTEGPSAA